MHVNRDIVRDGPILVQIKKLAAIYSYRQKNITAHCLKKQVISKIGDAQFWISVILSRSIFIPDLVRYDDMSRFTLKTKLTLFFPLVITLTMACMLMAILAQFQEYVKKASSTRQQQLVEILADDVDQSIVSHLTTLVGIAGNITPEMVADPKRALEYLQGQNEHRLAFDNGMFLFDGRGRMVAESPLGLTRTGSDFSFRDYFKQTIATGKPFLSDPYQSLQAHHHPAVMFTAPIFDGDGSLLGVLGGSVDLTKSSLFARLTHIKLGRSGYLFLFTSDRMMVLHPDASRIMKRDIPVGSNQLLDSAIAGSDGTGETVNSRGISVLSTFKHLKSNNWIIGANFPTDEAYADVNTLRSIFFIVVPLLSLLIFWFLQRSLSRLTDPIEQLTRHVNEIQQKSGDERLLSVKGDDEVAILGHAFNDLIGEIDRQRCDLLADLERRERADIQLHCQNAYLQALHETTLGLIKRLDVASLLQAIVTRAGSLIGTEHCYVYLKNSTGNELDMLFQSGIYNTLVHYPIKPGQGLAGRIWASGEPFNVEDYSRWDGRLPDSDRVVLHAMAGVPLKTGDEVVGVLGLAFIDEGVVFNDQQMELLSRFGELASLALENARLNEESQRELQERKKAEQDLRKLSVAVEQSPASVLITDTFGSIEYVNPHFTMLTGYRLEEVLGQNPSILKTGKTSSEEYKQLWETILSGGEWRGEFHNRKKNGDLYWEQALIAPIRDGQSITHFIAIKEDITERKQLEGQLRHVQKMEAVGQLAGGIAHDFNNILTAIVGYASILQLKLPEESLLKKTAEQITATAERGASLTQGLLAFSRKQTSNPVVVDLNEIIRRVHQLLLRLISEDIHLEINLDEQKLPVMADSGQIEQVLMNLATNARDAMPHGGAIIVASSIFVIDNEFVLSRGFGHPGAYALLTFTDSGGGMPAEIVKHVFEPFYTTKELGKGTGLGLSIVYGIIKKHNGFIYCNSTAGVGTSLEVYLPLLTESPVVSERNAPSGIASSQRGSTGILVAEDNGTARALTREILEEFGYVVVEAVDGQDALSKFKDNRERLSLVILDVIMPALNCGEVYAEIKSMAPSMRVLLCSGYAKDVTVGQTGLDEGMNFLAKPFTPKELLMKIREVLNDGH
jgi:PAS domain S-box-containing protein